MSYTQADADKLVLLRYAAAFPGEVGVTASADIFAFEERLGPDVMDDLERHLVACDALRETSARTSVSEVDRATRDDAAALQNELIGALPEAAVVVETVRQGVD